MQRIIVTREPIEQCLQVKYKPEALIMCENQENKQDFYTINLPVMVGCALPTLQTVVFGGFSQLSPGYLDSFCKKMAEMILRNHQLLVRKQSSYGVKSQMS